MYITDNSQVTDNTTGWASPKYLCMQILPHSQGKYARNICVCCMDNNEHWTYMSSNAEKALILFWRKSEKARFWKWVAWRCTHVVGGGGWSASQYTADICRDTEWPQDTRHMHARWWLFPLPDAALPDSGPGEGWGFLLTLTVADRLCSTHAFTQIHSVYKVHSVN